MATESTSPLTPSVHSLAKSYSHRSSRATAATIKTVVTSPPWARDEPPSPTGFSDEDHRQPPDPRPSDVASYQSSSVNDSMAGPSRWWTFARPRPLDSIPLALSAAKLGTSGRSTKERSLSISWLTPAYLRRSQDDAAPPPGRFSDDEDGARANPNMHVNIPPSSPFTLSQTETPGWETPWAPRDTNRSRSPWNGSDIRESAPDSNDEKTSPWVKRKKRLRVYMLTNVYVPLLFRFINITFTTVALAFAIRVRNREMHYGVMGALGASPTLVIIFAPLTLVHVMIAIYLEYFGRPLGLWRTSGKLAHTLIEVVFICAWSAALALSFDNFFTSQIPCASPSSISWYNDLPRTSSSPPLSNLSHDVGESICDNQLVLIVMVGVGLIMYCTNLVISLFRIFEKVKYHPVTTGRQ